MPPSPPEMWSLAWWDQIAPVVQMVVVVITGCLAVYGLDAWRRQIVGKRKAAIAEQVLVSFYSARDVIGWARTSSVGASEGESRKPDEDEPDQIRRMRNVYFIPIERLAGEKELFGKLRAQRYEFGAYFGNQNIAPFDTIFRIHSSIINIAQRLVIGAQYDSATQFARAKDDLLDALGWGKREGPDDTDRAIDAAVLQIEALCTPILQERRRWNILGRWRNR